MGSVMELFMGSIMELFMGSVMKFFMGSDTTMSSIIASVMGAFPSLLGYKRESGDLKMYKIEKYMV